MIQDVRASLYQRDVIAADGQNIRATRQTKKGNDAHKSKCYDLVSLYSTKYGLTISQRAVDKKNHEAEAILEMIATLNFEIVFSPGMLSILELQP